MNIKNLNVNKRLIALALAGVMTFTMVGCSSNAKKTDSINATQQQSYIQETKKIFGIGEHILSVPIEDPTKESQQHNYYDGYKCVGMGSSAYGPYFYTFGGASLLYVNEYPVECYATRFDKNNIPVYTTFGTPLEYEKTENNTTADTKDFGVGEHIISIPVEDPTKENVQYKYYEGYETIDIAISAYGQYFNSFGSACILYVNTVPVRSNVTSYDKNNVGRYTIFGTPIELEKTLAKSLN